jgi:Tfp pilus assembly protein PilN
MKRIDYLRPPRRRRTVLRIAADPRRRHLLGAGVLAVLVLCGTVLVELVRFEGARREGVALSEQLVQADADTVRARSLQRDLERLRGVAGRIETTRRAVLANASEIAALGNRLPPDVWLTSLRVGPDAIALEGRGARLDAVAAAMSALVQLPRFTQARLVSVRSDALRGGFDYAIALERSR